jgi:hypothetical protein
MIVQIIEKQELPNEIEQNAAFPSTPKQDVICENSNRIYSAVGGWCNDHLWQASHQDLPK